MADAFLRAAPRIREAFFHERLGVVLVCDVITVIGEATEGTITGEAFLMRTPCDGDPAYLDELRGFFKEFWAYDHASLSAN